MTIRRSLPFPGAGPLIACVLLLGCSSESKPVPDPGIARGRETFRHDTFGDAVFWTDTLQMNAVVETVSPVTALAVGLKVDADVLPAGILDTADLTDAATTVALLSLGAVVGIEAEVVAGSIVRLGVTCALCHSTVDDSVVPGIGRRLDGYPNRDLDPGMIISLSPVITDEQRAILVTWGPGRYDPRWNMDGLNGPVLIPPAYGLRDVALATYTGDGTVAYWNAYVAVTQMGGQGDFVDARIGVDVKNSPDLVTSKLDDLGAFELSLLAPRPPAGSFDAAAAERGKDVFDGVGRCADCHTGALLTDAATTLHAASETGMDPAYALRSATGLYRTTPLRALWQRAPYFHDGSAATLADVVVHYDVVLGLKLTAGDKADLVQYLESI
jgi:mono/diheme cytochrome c family protein